MRHFIDIAAVKDNQMLVDSDSSQGVVR